MTSPCLHNCDNKTSEGYCRTTYCINPIYNKTMVGPCPLYCDNKTSAGYCMSTGCINPAYNKPVQNIVCTSTCPVSNNRISLTMAKELRDRIELAQMTNENLELTKAEAQLLMDLLETLI